MNGKVKYKAFIKDRNAIEKVLNISFYKDSFVVKVSDVAVQGGVWLNEEDIVLLQYTGLEDKNGKEIYEGDIIYWEREIMQKKEWYGKVERLNASFVTWTSKKTRSSGEWLNVSHEQVDVVGNIYEHPYLWEGEIE